MNLQVLTMQMASAPERRQCFRCAQLGLADATIEPFEEHVEIIVALDPKPESESVTVGESYACADCLQRLLDEIQGNLG